MPDQPHATAGGFDLLGGEVGQLLHQVRPVAGDGVGGVVAVFFDGANVKPTGFQLAEQHAVGAGGEAVAVGKDDQRAGAGVGCLGFGAHGGRGQISFSSGVLILRSVAWRAAGMRRGTSVWAPSQTGSSMLSNTSRSLRPQLLCIMA